MFLRPRHISPNDIGRVCPLVRHVGGQHEDSENVKRFKPIETKESVEQGSRKAPPLQLLDADHHVEVTLGILLDYVSHIVGLPRLL